MVGRKKGGKNNIMVRKIKKYPWGGRFDFLTWQFLNSLPDGKKSKIVNRIVQNSFEFQTWINNSCNDEEEVALQ